MEVRYNTMLRQQTQKKQRTLKPKGLRPPLPQLNHLFLILVKAFFRKLTGVVSRQKGVIDIASHSSCS